MTSAELYYQFHLLLNENANFKNVKISEGNFVILFNRSAEKWLLKVIEKWNNSDDIFNIQELLQFDKELKFDSISKNDKVEKYRYKLPSDFFSYIDSHSFVSGNNCSIYLTNYLHKPKDIRAFINDDLPSLDYEEGLCNITNDFLEVFAKDFTIDSTYLSYFKEIEKIDLEGYENLLGENSKTINPTLPKVYLEQILDMCVTEVQRGFKDQVGFQLSKEREMQN